MLTYQDLLKVPDSDELRMEFVRKVIREHKSTALYKIADDAEKYDRQQNPTIIQYKKLLYDWTGRATPDVWSANYKLCSNFFNRFTTQENLYLLGNGVTFENESTKNKLGKDFDNRMIEAGKDALNGGVSFGFYNNDHVDVFSVLEFAPLYDEENGALRSGVRFWQVDETKPLRATLYEEDGSTEYEWIENKGTVLRAKQAYKTIKSSTKADGTILYKGENYPTFPIVPLWANPLHQSELVGIRENIDAYDLIKSGFANTIDDASEIYWVVQNAGGMDDVAISKFINRLKKSHGAGIDEDGAKAEPHTLEVPTEAREAILTRLRNDLYDDYMALDVKQIAGGATTATQIQAAYEPINSKADQYESCVTEFIQGLLAVAGIEDNPTYTRSTIVNTAENIQNVVNASEYLPSEYITRKILTLLGDGDMAEKLIAEMDAEELERNAYNINEQIENGNNPSATGGENSADES